MQSTRSTPFNLLMRAASSSRRAWPAISLGALLSTGCAEHPEASPHEAALGGATQTEFAHASDTAAAPKPASADAGAPPAVDEAEIKKRLHAGKDAKGLTPKEKLARFDALCAGDEADSDSDGLCDAAEESLGTDPDEDDTDDDSLNDGWEVLGVPVPGESGDRYDLAALGADPRHRDVFVELDYYAASPPRDAALLMVIRAFEEAPVRSHDSKPGIHLHIVRDDAISGADAIAILGDDAPVVGHKPTDNWVRAFDEFRPIRDKFASPARRKAFRYALWAREMEGGNSGWALDSPGQDFFVTLNGFFTTSSESDRVLGEAGTFMHELGHVLGLAHGGDTAWNYKPNYFSVMNYHYQMGVERVELAKPVSSSGPKPKDKRWKVIDYARFPVQGIKESSVDELLAFAPGDGATELQLTSYGVRICRPGDPEKKAEENDCRPNDVIAIGSASEKLDFDRDGIIDKKPFVRDLDGDGWVNDIPAAQNDWIALSYHGAGRIGTDGTGTGTGTEDDTPSHPPCDPLPRP